MAAAYAANGGALLGGLGDAADAKPVDQP